MRLHFFFASALTVLGLAVTPNNAFATQTVAYEIRRSTVPDYSSSTLAGITTSTQFLDTDANAHSTEYYYFVRATWGTQEDILTFGNTILATLFYPSSSSNEVPDLVYYTQTTSFSGTFFLLDDESPDSPNLIWPENEDLLSETITRPLGQQPRLLVRFKLLERLWTFDEDETVELIAYDPFSESIIKELGTVTKSEAVNWQANLTTLNTTEGIKIEWNSFQASERNSTIQTADITRDIPTPTPPTQIYALPEHTPGSIKLSWEKEISAATYNIYRSNTNDRELATRISQKTTANAYQDSNVTAGETYYYWVTSVNARGESEASASFSTIATTDVLKLYVQSPFGDITISPRKKYYTPGDEITVQANAHAGYAIANWSINQESVQTSPSYTFTIENDTNLVAQYETAMPDDYIDWISEIAPNETSLHSIGPDQDIDGDGLANYFEYILATDELSSSPTQPDYIALSPTENGKNLTLQISATPSLQRGNLWIVSSVDLKSWDRAQLEFQDELWTINGETAFDISIDGEVLQESNNRWNIKLTMNGQNPIWIRLNSPISD